VLRLRIGSIPIDVHFSHLVFSGLIAWSIASTKGTTWPLHILSNPNHPERTKIFAAVTVAWMLIITASMVFQELGRAFVIKTSGAQARIQLVGLGGVTKLEGPPLHWSRTVLVLLAGPAVSLVIGIVMGLLVLAGGTSLPEPVRYFAFGTAIGNLVFAGLNLVPISPLPGGQLVEVLLTRVMGRQGYLAAQILALALAGFIGLVSLLFMPLLTLLVGLMVLRTIANITAYQRGELPVGEAAHPLVAVLERAEGLYRERKLSEAQVIAAGVVEGAETPPLLRSRAHLLLGWIALKEGLGRRALDHFSQVQGLNVPPHALAAGFSLIGDEHRAVPLWAQAAQAQPQDEVVRHELAGALIRGGREPEARAMANVDLARAFLAAERVHYVRKEFESAARTASGAYEAAPTAAHAFTAACNWALAGHQDEAMRYLHLASQNGYRDAAAAREDPDLKSLRGRPEFEAWLTSLAA
jgi:Zn-dependent protease